MGLMSIARAWPVPFLLLTAGGLLGAASCKPPALDTPELAEERRQWRRSQDERMRGVDSPLSRVDYVHVPPGEHVLAPGRPPFKVTAEQLAPYTGELRLLLGHHGLSFAAAPPVLFQGRLQAEGALTAGSVLPVGRLRLVPKDLGKDPSLAVYDVEAPAKRAYQGLHYYPDNAAYITRGRLERYPEPRKVRVAATRGEDQEIEAVGMLRFTLLGKAVALEAYSAEPGTLFVIFRDETCGKPGQSYGAGRYLYAKAADDGSVLLDFNRAWSPLCAYSPFFHCPVPPRTNWIPFSIPVGEKTYHE